MQGLKSGVVCFVGVSEDGKAAAVVGVSADLTGKHSAVDLVRIAAAALGGSGGGGRPDMAQAGGPEGQGRSHRRGKSPLSKRRIAELVRFVATNVG